MQKYISTLGLIILLIFWGFTSSVPAENEETMTTAKLVLVELFTSQGCSSCPPADQVLKKLDEEAQMGTLPVVVLSYHVDYWNRLGWKDPYSSAEFSQRQRSYASKINDQGVYTPQVVIQGQDGLVGSREREVRSAISTASRQENKVNITATLVESGEETILNYEWGGKTADAVLHIALAEKELENAVPRGENRGRQLSHTNVVRHLITIDRPAVSDNLTIQREVFSEPENGKVVLFAQDRNTWEVLGVIALDLNMLSSN
jgi:hypothetical protein